MFDTDIIDGARVAYIEPKSLVHEILSYIAAQKIMAILCSENEGFDQANLGRVFSALHSRRIENNPNFVLTNEVSREFNLNPEGFKWLYLTHILVQELTLRATDYGVRHDSYITMTEYGEKVLNGLEEGEEVILYLD